MAKQDSVDLGPRMWLNSGSLAEVCPGCGRVLGSVRDAHYGMAAPGHGLSLGRAGAGQRPGPLADYGIVAPEPVKSQGLQ